MKVSRRPSGAILALVLGLGLGAPGRGAAEPTAPPPWRHLDSGLELRVQGADALHPDWPPFVLLVRLDPAAHRLAVLVPPPETPDRADGAGRDAGALAVINGGFFDAAGRPLGWLVADGRPVSPLAPKGWGVFVVPEAGAPLIVAAGAVPEGLVPREALQAGPRLVVAGRPNRLKAQVARRSFVGLDGVGRLVLGSTGLLPAGARGLAAFLAEPEERGGAGLVEALALDGGSSAQLWVRGAGEDGSDLVVPGGVAVPSLLAVLPAATHPVPAATPPTPAATP